MQFADDQSLLSASRSGNAAASERVVRRYQAELLRAGYLLTGSSGKAAALARDTFLRFFEDLVRGNEEDDGREQLLGTMARLYMANPSRGELTLTQQPFIPAGGATRYAVDDQRGRVMSALERLEVQERTALVLREFSAFDEEAVSRVFHRPPHDLRAMLHPARTRVHEAAGASEHQSVRELLTNAASDATLVELWPELEDPLQRVLAREEVRRKWMIAGASVAVGLVVIAVAVWLFGLNPFAEGDGSESSAVASNPTIDIQTPTSPPEPTPEPSPTIDLSALQAPVASVPGKMFLTYEVEGETNREMRQVLYDPATGDTQPVAVQGDSTMLISADGKWFITLRFSSVEQGSPIRLNGVSTETGDVVWERDIPEIRGLTFSGSHLYAITRDEVDTLIGIDLATGESSVERVDFLDGIEIANDGGLASYQLLGSPDGSHLFMVMWEQSSIGTARNQVLATYTLPDLEIEDSMVRANTASDGQFADDFQFYQARVTPDGQAIYVPGNDRVQFLSTVNPDPLTVELPFIPLPPESQLDLIWATSNDGRYLYAIAAQRKQVAIVDLIGRSVSRSFPLDSGGFTLLPQESGLSLANIAMNGQAVVSPDGQRLLIVGAWQDPALPIEPNESSIWAIDLETWQVTGRYVIRGQANNVAFVSGEGQAVVYSIFQSSITSLDREHTVTVLDLNSGEVIAQHDLVTEILPELAARILWTVSTDQMYRQLHGRTPAIDGVQPETVETVSTLPRLNLAPASTSVASGGSVQLMLQVLDPATGGPLETASEEVRFDPASNPIFVLRQQGGDAETILVPSRTSPAEYSASTPLEATGSWDVEIQFTTSDGQPASVTFPGLFQIIPSVPSVEGPRYSLRIETPDEPAARQEVLVRASFVDIETGSVLPEGTELRGGLPDTLTVTFFHAEHGFFSDTLTETRHGVYEGPVQFRNTGSWQVEVSFWSDELNQSVKISGGTVDVVPPGP